MFCQKCGKMLNDNARFCDACGAPVGVQPQPSYQSQQAQPTQPQKKKKGAVGILITVVVVALAGLIGGGIGNFIGESMSGSNDDDGAVSSIPTFSTVAPTESATEATEARNEAFYAVFNERYIVHLDTLFYGMDSEAFAIVTEDGLIDCMEFGYNDDTVKSIVETIYIDISDLSDSDRDVADTDLRNAYSPYEALEFVTISYDMGNSYYTITIRMENLDRSDVLDQAVSAGLLTLTGSDADYISMAQTESGLLAQGYIQR